MQFMCNTWDAYHVKHVREELSKATYQYVNSYHMKHAREELSKDISACEHYHMKHAREEF